MFLKTLTRKQFYATKLYEYKIWRTNSEKTSETVDIDKLEK